MLSTMTKVTNLLLHENVLFKDVLYIIIMPQQDRLFRMVQKLYVFHLIKHIR